MAFPILGMAAIAAGNAIMQNQANQQNIQAQQDANQANIGMAREQMRFQEFMSETAHQREVRDLRQAGLNPILSASGGGASTPSGAMGQSSAPQITAPQISMPDMMAYGVSLKQIEQKDQELAIAKANSASQIAKNLTDSELSKAETILKKKGLIRAELEGEAAERLKAILKVLKKSFSFPDPKQLENMHFNNGQGVNLSPK